MSRTNRRQAANPIADASTWRATETDAALNAGEALATLKLTGQVLRAEAGGRPYRITEDGRVETMEGFLLAPVMRRGDVEVYESISFVNYYTRFKDKASVIFADKVKNTFTGILDYHESGPSGAARWARHRIVLPLRPTRSWLTWSSASSKAMNQTQFSKFLETNIPDIYAPAGALIVEIARTLEAKKNVVFESNISRQTDGSFKFLYSEDVQGSAGRGNIQIPDVFTLVLQPFEGSDKVQVEARFRYRIADGGKLEMWFELVRPEVIVEEAFTVELARIAGGTEPSLILAGPAPAAQTA